MPLTPEQVKAIQSQPGAIDWFGQPLKVDGDYGPKTRWWHFITSLSQQRKDVITLALSYYATNVAEVPLGSNRGPLIDKFMEPTGLKPGKPWCAGFASHCLRQSGTYWPIYHASAWSVIEWAKKYNRVVTEPMPGDLEAFLYPKQPNEDWRGHVRIVVSYDPSTKISYGVDGNITNMVRVGFRRDRENRYFIRPAYEDVLPQLPTNMMPLDNLGTT